MLLHDLYAIDNFDVLEGVVEVCLQDQIKVRGWELIVQVHVEGEDESLSFDHGFIITRGGGKWKAGGMDRN